MTAGKVVTAEKGLCPKDQPQQVLQQGDGKSMSNVSERCTMPLLTLTMNWGAAGGWGGAGGRGLGLTDRFNQRGRFLQHPAAAAGSTAGRGAAANKAASEYPSCMLGIYTLAGKSRSRMMCSAPAAGGPRDTAKARPSKAPGRYI